MTTEQPRIPSARNLQEGFGRGPNTPIRDVRGVLVSITDRTETRGPEGGQQREVVVNQLNLDSIEVLESVEPYQYPTCTIEIDDSSRKNSRWGCFSMTLTEIIPEEEDLVDQIGKSIRLRWYEPLDEDGLIRKYHDLGFKDKNWKPELDEAGAPLQTEAERPNVLIDCWEVVEVEGTGRGEIMMTAEQKAIQLLNGQNLANFNKAAMSDALIKNDATFRASLLDGTFVNRMVEIGKFTKGKDGIFRIVEETSETDEEPTNEPF